MAELSISSAEGARNEAPKAPSLERRRRENRGAEGAEQGGVWGGVIPLPSRIGGLGERRKLPQRCPAANAFLVHYRVAEGF